MDSNNGDKIESAMGNPLQTEKVEFTGTAELPLSDIVVSDVPSSEGGGGSSYRCTDKYK